MQHAMQIGMASSSCCNVSSRHASLSKALKQSLHLRDGKQSAAGLHVLQTGRSNFELTSKYLLSERGFGHLGQFWGLPSRILLQVKSVAAPFVVLCFLAQHLDSTMKNISVHALKAEKD